MKPAERRSSIVRELAAVLSAHRMKRGISENSLAKLAGLSQSMVARLKKPDANPSLDSLLRIADALEINLADALKRAIRNAELAVSKQRKA